MPTDEAVARLERQLSKEGLGPVAALSNQALTSLLGFVRDIAAALRRSAFDHPLTTLLISFEVGYALARTGRRDARR